MTAKFSASADGTKVNIGNAAEDALQIDSTAKTIKALAPYRMASNGPAFLATVNPVAGNTSLVQLGLTEVFDTDNCFASSAFTPNVAGYYQLNANISTNQPTSFANLALNINGVQVIRVAAAGQPSGDGSGSFVCCSTLRYFNGTTDSATMLASINTAGFTILGGSFSGALVRQA